MQAPNGTQVAGTSSKSGYHQQENRERERELSAQAELAYRRLVTD